jgi:hypothetical protein
MLRYSKHRTLALGALAVAMLPAIAVPAVAEQVSVRIEQLRSLDQADPLGQTDFFARVTIDGQVQQTRRIRRANVVNPNWVFTVNTNNRSVDVKIEIFDKDVLTPSDKIDINRVDNKRDLDFRVVPDGRRCRILDFANGYRCGDKIVREGRERKKAEITFSVESSR